MDEQVVPARWSPGTRAAGKAPRFSPAAVWGGVGIADVLCILRRLSTHRVCHYAGVLSQLARTNPRQLLDGPSTYRLLGVARIRFGVIVASAGAGVDLGAALLGD